MIEQLKECIEAVSNINEQLQEQLYSEKYDMDPWIYMETQIGPDEHVVKFLGECIYNTNDDPRKWIEESRKSYIDTDHMNHFNVIPGHYEPIEQYLRTKAMELLSKLSKIHL